MSELAVIESNEIISAFSNSLEPLLLKIEKSVSDIVPDTSTLKGRTEIKSLAFMVTKSKTAIDKEAKKLVSGVNEQMKAFTDKKTKINADRKMANERLSNLSKKIRLPLTEYEIEQEVKKQKQDVLNLMDDAIDDNKRFDFNLELMEREEAIKTKEAEQQADRDRIERDNKIREEQSAKLEQARLASIESEKRALQAEKDKQEAIKQALIDKAKHEEDAKKRQAQNLIDESKRKKQEEINLENMRDAEAKRLEKERVLHEQQALADNANVSRVKNGIYNSLKFIGLSNSDAKITTVALCDGEISDVKVVY